MFPPPFWNHDLKLAAGSHRTIVKGIFTKLVYLITIPTRMCNFQEVSLHRKGFRIDIQHYNSALVEKWLESVGTLNYYQQSLIQKSWQKKLKPKANCWQIEKQSFYSSCWFSYPPIINRNVVFHRNGQTMYESLLLPTFHHRVSSRDILFHILKRGNHDHHHSFRSDFSICLQRL